MKRFLRWSLDFLDRKFPDKVTVRLVEYRDLQSSVKAHTEKFAQIDQRLQDIATAMNNINLAIGVVTPKSINLQR